MSIETFILVGLFVKGGSKSSGGGGKIPLKDLRNATEFSKGTSALTSKAKRLGASIGNYDKDSKKIPQRDLRKQALIDGAKQAAKKALDQKAKQLAYANAADTFGLSVVAYYGIKHWRVTLTIIIALCLILFLLLDGAVFDAPPTDEPTTSDTCVPDQFTGDAFGKTAVCTISVTYDGSASDVTIISTILPGTEYVSSGVITNTTGRGGTVTVPGGTFDKASNTVTWDAGRLNLPLDPININVTVTVRITTHQNNTVVYNAYSVNAENLQSGTTGSSTGPGGNVPPNHSTCNGKYNLTSPYENFGDPNCDFTIQQFGQEARQMDSAHYLIWDCMTAHESGYNPNAYNPNSTSGKGAYGLLQMNPKGQGNGKYDAGNVVWSLQISNAINYNKVINGSFAYWATYAGCH